MKAQLQIQFNWIFVIIIGSILLLFFFGLINAQSKTTDDRISISQSQYFETVITATGQKVGTLKEYRIPGLETEFVCDVASNTYSYSVENLPARDTKYDIIFSPSRLVGDDVQTWTQEWSVPFRAASFLYITNSLQGFIFYNYSQVEGIPFSTTDFQELIEDFPRNLSTYVVDTEFTFEDVADLNLDRYTYIFLLEELPSTIVFDSRNENRILIYERGAVDVELTDYGTIYELSETEFNSRLNNIRTWVANGKVGVNPFDGVPQTGYMGKASMYGMPFSEDISIYECTMDKAFTRLALMTQLHTIRIEALIVDQGLSTACRNQLGQNDNPDQSNAFLPRDRLYYLFDQVLSQGFEPGNIPDIYRRLYDIDDNNKQLLGLSNCPPIY